MNETNLSKRIFALREEKEWDIKQFDTIEKIKAEISRLNDAMNTDKDMPSFYYENIEKHISELKDKADKIDNKDVEKFEKCKDCTEKDFLNKMKEIENSTNNVDSEINEKFEYFFSINRDNISNELIESCIGSKRRLTESAKEKVNIIYEKILCENFYDLFEKENSELLEELSKKEEKEWRMITWSVKFIKEDGLNEIIKDANKEIPTTRKEKIVVVRELINNIPEENRQKILNSEEFKKAKELGKKSGYGKAAAIGGAGAASSVGLGAAGLVIGVKSIAAGINASTIGEALGGALVAIVGGVLGLTIGVALGIVGGISGSIIAKYNSKRKATGLMSIDLIKNELKNKDSKINNLSEDRLPSDPDKDPEFGIPEEKKYPLFDEKHVRSAIKLFGHVEPKYEKELARAVKRRMTKYNISTDEVGDDNKLKKYLTESEINEDMKKAVQNGGKDLEDEITERAKKYHPTELHTANTPNKLKALITKTEKEYETDAAKITEDYSELFESVIDPVHDNLCQDLFDGDEIREDIIDYIAEALKKWKETIGLKTPIVKITCSGSLLTYQYNPTTDLDVHVYIDGTDEDIDKAWAVMPAGVFIPNTNHPIEYTFMKTKGNEDDKNAENLYDIVNKQWIKRTTKENMGSQVPTNYITRISKFYMMAVDAAIGQADVHKKELANLENMEIESNFSEEEKVKAIKEKINDLIEDRDSLYFIVKLLRSFRTVGYNVYDKANKLDDLLGVNFEIKLPDDPHYSLNEMIFKTIERFGYKSKVDEYVKELEGIISKYENETKPVVNGEEEINRK